MKKLLWLLPIMINCSVACSGSSDASDAAGGGAWTVSDSLVSEIEASLEMPSNAFPLNTYVRYFAGEDVNGRRIVVGTFLHDAENAGVRIVDRKQMPEVFDGGCAVVNLKYDIERKKVLALFCNGEA